MRRIARVSGGGGCHAHPAFTRIEMLLVLGVLTLLVCLFWPRDSAAQARARTATCRSQMHRLVLALRMYTEDYDGCFPCDENWDRALVQRLRVPTPFVCPEVRLPGEQPDPGPHPPSRFVPGYAMNSCLAHWFPPGGQPSIRPVPISQVRYPSLTVAFCETRPESRLASQPDNAGRRPEITEVGGRRHHGGANYAFVDGSVRWYPPEDVTGYDPRFPPDGATPNFQIR